MRKYKEVSHKKLRENLEKLKNGTKYPFRHAELLFGIMAEIFEPLIESNQFTYRYVHGPTTFGQAVRPKYEWNFYKPYDNSRDYWINELYETPFLIYWNTRGDAKVKNMTVHEFLSKDLLINRLLRLAFERILVASANCLTVEIKKIVLKD